MYKILIADDAAFMRMMLADILKKAGHEVVGQAANGLEAVEKFKELRPDIVISDITMPDMDGIQAVKEIRQIDARAKVIMCSALGQKEMVSEAIKSGAKDIVLKPFKADQVLESIEKVCRMTEELPVPAQATVEKDEYAENWETPVEISLIEKAECLLKQLSDTELAAAIVLMESIVKNNACAGVAAVKN
jgi:two-component system chemotaxis response regulator CheY